MKADTTLKSGTMSQMTIWGRSFLAIVMYAVLALRGNSAVAQIVPDRTLPNNSNVTVNGSTFNIDGGTTAGRNLFHSFQQFSVPTGGTASFNNGADIQNIISRVTGGSASNIDGLIKASGTANLFLINPSGIIFGQNASLNVGGSFVGTTANAIQFGNFGFFSATNPEAPSPLLTINPSALLFNQIAAAQIQNNNSSLSVLDNKSLLLVGGDIKMNGGGLSAYGGRVELGGLAASGFVGLNVDGDKLSLDFPASSTPADISLTNSAYVSVRAGGGGDIAVNARNLEVSGESTLSAGIRDGLGNAGAKAGDITLNATGEIKLVRSDIANIPQTQGIGNGGNITISSGSLSLTDGSFLSTATSGQGDVGNVFVQAKDSVSITGSSSIFTNKFIGAIGKGGDITISSGSLSLTDGGILSTTTSGQGDAGNVFVQAKDSVSITGSSRITGSGIYTSTLPEAIGKGGNITISSGSLSLNDGGSLNTSIQGRGDAGNVFLNVGGAVTIGGRENSPPSGIFSAVSLGAIGKGGNITISSGSLSLTDNAYLLISTLGQGQAGNVFVQAKDSVSITGSSRIFTNNADSQAVGNGGNITIDSGSFSLRDGAQLSAQTFGQGNAGTIKVNAVANINISGKSSDSISGLYVGSQSTTGTAGDIIVTSPRVTLDNSGTLNAQSASGNGGNINLQSGLLLLRHGAQISTTAGGSGGNITINTPNGFIVSVPNENSDITANAFKGSGGVIKINALDIYNFTQRSREDLVRELRTDDPNLLNPRRLQTNDITAFSQTSPTLSGQVNINTPDIDPSRGLVQLPTVVVNTPKLISSGCAAASDNSFTITGRGGLPPSPTEPLTNDVVWTDARLPAVQQHSSNKPKAKPHTKPKAEPIAIVPATGWVFNKDKGEVTLISKASSTNNLGATPATCPTRHERIGQQ